MQHANAVIIPVYFHGNFRQNIDMFVQYSLRHCTIAIIRGRTVSNTVAVQKIVLGPKRVPKCHERCSCARYQIFKNSLRLCQYGTDHS